MHINRWSDDIDSPNNEPIYCGNPSKEIWTTREGTSVQVGDMTDQHLNNCWKMVEGKNTFWEQVFEAETKKRARGGIGNEMECKRKCKADYRLR